MLHSLLPDQNKEFLCQGDPAASVFFSPFTSSLSLPTWSAALCEATLSYMDNVNELGEDEKDILVTDEVCRDFEAASGAILNRNQKIVIFSLSSWLGRRDWPLL
jgi:hypothetical protein